MGFRELFYDTFSNIVSYKSEENFNMFKIFLESSSIPKLNLSFFTSLKSLINTRDFIFSLTLSFNGNDSIQYNDTPEDFIEEVNDELLYIEKFKSVLFKIEITKIMKDKVLSIYDLDEFSDYLISLSLSSFIYNLHNISKHSFFFFELQDTANFISYSNLLCFKSKNSVFEKVSDFNLDIIKSRKSICNFLNDDIFNFEPDNFVLSNSVNEKIDLLFDKLRIIYSLISIFNISQIKDNSINLTINGYKSSEFSINFNSLDVIRTSLYYEIYSWIYSEGTLSDKVGIVRNIISLYLVNSNNINIDKSALTAIKSNYNMYLKENVERYIELKSSIVESIISFEKSIYETTSTVTDAFIKNIGAIGTFIITAIIMNSFSEKILYNIFTKDITIISLALILVSIIYLIYTLIETKSKMKSIITTYYRFKNSYSDLLVRKDINKLFNRNRYFKKDIRNANTKIKLYILLWILVLTVFLLIILSLGFEHVSSLFYKYVQ